MATNRKTPLAAYPVANLADLIAATHGLIADARINGGHMPQDVRLAAPVTLSLAERVHRDGGVTRRLVLDIQAEGRPS